MNNIDKVNLQPIKISIPFPKISERISAFSDIMQEFAKTLSKSLEFYSKIDFSVFQSKEFKEYINNISKELEEHVQKTPTTLESYLNNLEKRTKEYKEMMDMIKKHPLKSINDQIKKEAHEKGIEEVKINRFIKVVNNSITNLVISYSNSIEEDIVDQLCEQELSNINTNYYLNNLGLQIINPNKYNDYKILIKKALSAYYQDFKAFVNTNNSCFKIIDHFFLKLMNKMEILQSHFNSAIPEIQKSEVFSKNEMRYPKNIFENQQAFDFFTEFVNNTTIKDNIGFAFRQMKEVEHPPLILVNEVPFRTWFNNQKSPQLELKSPIKTLANIKGKEVKLKTYNLIRAKYIALENNNSKVA